MMQDQQASFPFMEESEFQVFDDDDMKSVEETVSSDQLSFDF